MNLSGNNVANNLADNREIMVIFLPAGITAVRDR
jgi:hypothetical protein